MQYRVYNRQTLEYVDGGYVQTFNIDDDYIVNNNSTISVVKKVDNTLSNVVVGDIIVLIQDSGVYHKGVITAVDDTAYTISYKSDKELFNDNMLNPFSAAFAEDSDLQIAGKFGVDILIEILKTLFVDTTDTLKKLPLVFIADGDVLDDEGNPKMLWTWSNDSINIVDWLTELFEKYNLSLSWDIDFDISNDLTVEEKDDEYNPNARHPRYIVTLSAITKSGGIIKDNVAMQTINYTVKEPPDATVCYVIDSSTKELVTDTDGKNAIYYLYEKDGIYSISQEKSEVLEDGRERVLPVKTTIATYNESSTSTDETTPEEVATDKLIPSQFNQAIEIRISSDSKMFDFANAKFGDQYQIINEYGSVNSVFTGKKFSNSNKWVTLYFGLGRQNYTDLIQMRMRKSRYTEVYNQS